jgi:hypothetical protein
MSARGSAFAISGLEPAEDNRGPSAGRGHDERGHFGVAIILAIAAIAAAIIGTRASFIASDASDQWQSSLRTEVKRSAGVLIDIQSLYETELPTAVILLRASAFQQQLQAAAAGQSGAVKQALDMEAAAQAELVNGLASLSKLASQPEYALPSGGFDLARRLADLRSTTPNLIALDPDALQAEGDRLSNKAQLLTFALIPIGVSALLGLLGQPFERRRRLLLACALIALAAGIAMALGVEVWA